MQTEQRTVWICQLNSEAPLVSVQLMHRGYLEEQDRSSQEHAVTQDVVLSPAVKMTRFLSHTFIVVKCFFIYFPIQAKNVYNFCPR